MSLPQKRALHKDSSIIQIPRLRPTYSEGRYIRARTFLRGISIKKIADGLGVSSVSVHRTIYGKIRSANTEKEIARILGKADWNEVVLEARSEVQKKPVEVILNEMRQREQELSEASLAQAGTYITENWDQAGEVFQKGAAELAKKKKVRARRRVTA